MMAFLGIVSVVALVGAGLVLDSHIKAGLIPEPAVNVVKVVEVDPENTLLVWVWHHYNDDPGYLHVDGHEFPTGLDCAIALEEAQLSIDPDIAWYDLFCTSPDKKLVKVPDIEA